MRRDGDKLLEKIEFLELQKVVLPTFNENFS